jgi:uncharacterized protein YbjQ (UPF0145 family)
MGLFDLFRKQNPESKAQQAANEQRLADIQQCLKNREVPATDANRLQQARAGALPWMATLTPAELLIARTHGFRPIATVSATCWLHYGYSWTLGHSEGWTTALHRLRDEAYAAGANCVLDVKMRTIPLGVPNSMDFTLVGTAAYVEGLEPSGNPVIATVPALEFVKLLEADVVPTGIAAGAHYEMSAGRPRNPRMEWMGNVELQDLSQLWTRVRDRAYQDMRANARSQGNGVLGHVSFGESYEIEDPRRYLVRHIVIATTVDARAGKPFPHDVKIVVDLHAGRTPLIGTAPHHQSYGMNEREGAI